MFNLLLVFFPILIFFRGQCLYGVNGNDQPDQQQLDNIDGIWYAVMTTGCTDDGPCNIFTNNKPPCSCMSINFIPLQEAGWLVFMNSVNNATATLTVDIGGAKYEPSDSKTEVQGFIYKRATMPLSVVSSSEKFITEKVSGSQNFLKFKISIIGSSLEFVYMITTMTMDGGQSLTVIWCRKRHPGKATIWTAIVKNLKKLSIEARSLTFISQDGCKDPTENQYNEIFFC